MKLKHDNELIYDAKWYHERKFEFETVKICYPKSSLLTKKLQLHPDGPGGI